jgi:heme A synthase
MSSLTSNSRRLWLAATLPPLVWGAQGLFGWYVASHGCPGTSQPWSLTTARVAVVIFTLVALAVSVGAFLVAARHYRDEQPDKLHTLSMIGLLVGGVLTLALLFAGLPALMIAHCGEMR